MNDKEEYFKLIYLKLKHKIYRLCLGFMGNKSDADDLFQDVLLKIWKGLDNFREESSIDTWVYRITTNTALLTINKANKAKKRETETITNNYEITNIDFGSSERENEINKLYKAISSLKEIDRIIISLILEGSSYKEISEITGISISNVGARISRIKKKLLTIIK